MRARFCDRFFNRFSRRVGGFPGRAPTVDLAKIDDDAVGLCNSRIEFTRCLQGAGIGLGVAKPKCRCSGKLVALDMNVAVEEPRLIDLHISKVAGMRTADNNPM